MGAGEAATGIANLTVSAMKADGLDDVSARNRCWLIDSKGLVVTSRSGLGKHKAPFAHDHPPVNDFIDAIEALKPTVIIGVAAVGGTFNEAVVRKMAALNARPMHA